MTTLSDTDGPTDLTQHPEGAGQHSSSGRLFQPIDHYFLGSAAASLLVSVVLWFLVDQPSGLFVGLWVPSILALWTGVKITLLHHSTATN